MKGMVRRDYYKALGVSSTAEQEEIQKAYRRLAQTWHPDVSDAAGAEERFKEIAEAYEVLGDREKREKYDRSTGPQGRARSGPRHSGSEEIRPGRSVEPEYYSVLGRDPFGKRGTSGIEDITDTPWRRGRGRDRRATLHVPVRDAMYGGFKIIELERVLYGMDGRPQQVMSESFQLNLPRGLTDGSVIRVPGHGGPGGGGGADGDLYLEVRVIPDE